VKERTRGILSYNPSKRKATKKTGHGKKSQNWGEALYAFRHQKGKNSNHQKQAIMDELGGQSKRQVHRRDNLLSPSKNNRHGGEAKKKTGDQGKINARETRQPKGEKLVSEEIFL